MDDANQALCVTSHRIMRELSENGLIEDYAREDDGQQAVSSTFGGEG